MSLASKAKTLVSPDEESQILRCLMVWANQFTGWPTAVKLVRYEILTADAPCVALSVTQPAAVTKRYIVGGHQAEITFKAIYRINPGESDDMRLKADELLDLFGAWAFNNYPVLGDGVNVRRVEVTERSSIVYQHENGDEDHQILIKLTYEVI